MKLLITGASGFVGSRLAAYYQEKYEVWAPAHEELDFTDDRQAAEKVAAFGPEVILHCGAISDVAACAKNPALSEKVNVEGTGNLARASAAAGAKFVFCSSDQVYFRGRKEGEGREEFLASHKEEEACRPLPLYGQQKLRAERKALSIQPDSVILRLTWMYGPLTQAELAKGRNNLFTILQRALREQTPVSFSETDYRGVTDIGEVVRNMEAAWRLPGGIYNYGSTNDTNMYETVRRVLEAAGREELLQKKEGGALRNLTMDTARLERAGIRFSRSGEGAGHLLITGE